MKENRITEIRTRLMNHGPVAGECYTIPEIVDLLVDLQEAMPEKSSRWDTRNTSLREIS